MDQLEGDEKPLHAALRIGAIYDTRVRAASGTNGSDKDDTGLAVSAGLGYELPLEGPFGIRMDYGGYGDFHLELDQFNIQEHHLSIEPQYAADRIIYSLPLSIAYKLEGRQSDATIKSIAPAVTCLMNSGTGAVAFYGNASQIKDEDDNATLNENGTSLGMGLSYIHLKKTTSTLLSVNYSNTDYDALVKDYGTDPDSQKKRSDKVINSTLDIHYRMTPDFGIYAAYSFIHTKSNVRSYDHNRQIFEIGMAFKY